MSHADFCNKEHQPGSTPCARIVPANPALTPLELMQETEGARVYDATGDEWTKEDGKWVCNDARLLPESLIHVWGPITKEEQ